VLHLLQQQQVDPRQVLVITFTNKARGELQDRLQSALPPATAKKLYISTFHGLAYDILRYLEEFSWRRQRNGFLTKKDVF
jgi:DNA helicase-2/ATP-dependent DNA helicase PcrA